MAESPLTFVVSYDQGEGVINRLIKVASKTAVLERGKEAFGLSGHCFCEYFHADYQTYIRVDSLVDLPDGGKVRIIPARTPQATSVSVSPASTEPSPAPLDLPVSPASAKPSVASPDVSVSTASTEPVFLFDEQGAYLVNSPPSTDIGPWRPVSSQLVPGEEGTEAVIIVP